MTASHLLKLDDRGYLHCLLTLQQYLPGVNKVKSKAADRSVRPRQLPFLDTFFHDLYP